MKLLLCFTSFISLVVASDVLSYSNKDFAEKIPIHDLALVEFFAPWCYDCKMLDPVYEEAARKLKDNDPPVPLIKVDCTVDTGTCVQYGAQNYPIFKVFRNGNAEDYTGRVTAAGIVKKLKYMAGPASKELKTYQDVNKFLGKMDAETFLANDEYSVIGFFRDDKSDLANIYRKVADPVKLEVLFAHTTEQTIRDKYNYNDAIVLFQPFIYQTWIEENIRKYDGEASAQKLTDWIRKESLGLCSERTPENAYKFRTPLFVVYYDMNFFLNRTNSFFRRLSVLKVAKKFQDEGKDVNFAISNHHNWVHELETFGLTEMKNDNPVFVPRDKPVVTARDTRERKYVMPDEFSEQNLEKFVNDVLDERIEQYLKSDPIPLSNNEPVKANLGCKHFMCMMDVGVNLEVQSKPNWMREVVVAKNFDEIVNNVQMDVLIEFYSPLSTHCQKFASEYKKLARKLKNEPDLLIAKMDATTNELPKPYEYSKLPMIYIARKGDKKNPKLYTDDLEVYALIKFIAKESTNELKGYTREGNMRRKTEF